MGQEYSSQHASPVTNQIVAGTPYSSAFQYIIESLEIGGSSAGTLQILDDTNTPIDGYFFSWAAGYHISIEFPLKKMPAGRGIRYTTTGGGTHSVVLKYYEELITGPIEATPPNESEEPGEGSSFEWTPLIPSQDSRIVYVSDSDGNDADDGLTEVTAKKTISAGVALLRTGFPDWLLLKCGDTFTSQTLGTWTKSGRGITEPMLVASYGSGARPFIRTGTSNCLSMFTVTVNYLTIVGLKLNAHTRVGTEGTAGFQIFQTSSYLTFEDLYIEGYCNGFTIQADDGQGTINNIKIRRCVIVDSYSSDSTNSQGIFAQKLDTLLIEECIFDQNGWAGNGAFATVFDHNSYISSCNNVTLRGNYYLRASSIGTKFATSQGLFSNTITVEDCTYIEGEIGISAGGNDAGDYRFINFTARDNVMMHLGRTQPTARDVGWYFDTQDWDGGLVEGNLFLHNDDPDVDNSFGIRVGDSSTSCRNITYRQNIVYNVQGDCMRMQAFAAMSGIVVEQNEFQDSANAARMVNHTGTFSPITYRNNKYQTNAAASSWFAQPGDTTSTYTQWLTASGEQGSSIGAIAYPDPTRDETDFAAHVGLAPTFAALITALRGQSKANWNNDLRAQACNDFIRAGFGR